MSRAVALATALLLLCVLADCRPHPSVISYLVQKIKGLFHDQENPPPVTTPLPTTSPASSSAADVDDTYWPRDGVHAHAHAGFAFDQHQYGQPEAPQIPYGAHEHQVLHVP